MNAAEGGKKEGKEQRQRFYYAVVRHTTQSSGHCLVIAGFREATLFIFFAIRWYHGGIAQLTPALLFLHSFVSCSTDFFKKLITADEM